MSFDLASYLTGQGHRITVVCPQPSRPLSADYSQYKNPGTPVVTCEEGISVVRLPSFIAPESRLLPRMRESFSFGLEAVKFLAAGENRPAVLYVNSWPMFSQALITRFAKKNGIPVVLQIMDIYPEAFINKLPAFFRSVVHVPLKQLDTWIARAAASVVVISESMRRAYTENRNLSAESVVTVPTWQDERLFDGLPAKGYSFRRYGIPEGPFTFLYLGNIGPVAGVDFLIRAFSAASIESARLLIAGDGSAKASCVDLVEKLGVQNILFISDPDAANVPILQCMADVCMLPLKQGAGQSSIPSKLPAYMLSAKPVIATVDSNSDTACMVRQARCGWVGEPGDLAWLSTKMREVVELPSDELAHLGQCGREFGLAFFSRAAGVAKVADTIIRSIGVTV